MGYAQTAAIAGIVFLSLNGDSSFQLHDSHHCAFDNEQSFYNQDQEHED